MKDNPEEDALKEYFESQVKKFEHYSDNLKELRKIFAELGFPNVEDICDGFCPECVRMLECEVYEMIKDEWDRIYS